MILAAGFGTRLRPLTQSRPKALVEAGGVSLLAAHLERLRPLKPNCLLVNGHYRVDQLKAFLAQNIVGWRDFRLLVEEPILETGGALKNAAPFVRGAFLVTVNVDAATDLSPALVVADYYRRPSLATLLLHDEPRFNQVEVDPESRIIAFGRRRAAPGNRLLAYTGIQLCSPLLLQMLACEKATAFPLIPFYQRLLAAGRRDLRAVVVASGQDYYWRDIGTPDELAALETDLYNRPGLARRMGFYRQRTAL
jgi:mannose-1-phosphate guanylyltransferase